MIWTRRHRGANSMISDQALQEFKTIWREETGQEMTEGEEYECRSP
jgi:hypothetical protein